MAEKEERILVLKATEDDFIYKHFNGKGFIPRQETIKRMAKELYAHTWKSRTPMVRVQNWEIGVTDQNKKRYLGLAEAALNALLSEEK